MKNASILVVLTFIVGLITNDIGLTNQFLLLCSAILTVLYTRRTPLYGNFAKYIVLVGVYFSVVLIPSFHLIVDKNMPTQADYNRFTSFGAPLYFITIIAFTLFDTKKKNNNQSIIQYEPVPLSNRFVNIFFVLIYSLTAIAFTLGIGRMGGEDVVLPFHLTGVINLFRFYAVSFIFAAIVENYILRGELFPRKYFVLYFVWILFEIFAWMSKSVLVSYLLPLMGLLYMYYRPPLKKIIKLTAPLIALFLFLYPVIGIMRSMDSGNFIENMKEARSEAYDDNEDSHVLLTPLNRLFMTGPKYIRDYTYFNEDVLFDFTKLPMVIAAGGSPAFQTRVIDGFDESAHTSSGTTGIIDPMFHGGLGLCYIIVVLLVIVAIKIDSQFWKRQFGIYVVLLIMIYNWILFANLSALYDGNGLQTTFMEVSSIIFAYYINFRKKEIVSKPA